MAVLVGNSGAAITTGGSTHGADEAHWFKDGYTATAGTIATAYLETGATGSNLKICIWNSSGTLVASTAAIASAVGVVSASISGTLTASLYYIGWVADGYTNIGRINVTGFSSNHEANSYTTPADVTIPGGESNMGETRIWIEGTADGGGGGGGVEILANHFYHNTGSNL